MMRIEALTFLRFIAAIIVIIFHYGRNTDVANFAKPFILSGPQMVTFFFTLSGFVMMVAHYHRNNESVRSYYVARIARIFPLYLLALIVTGLFFYGNGNNNLTSLFLSFTLLQSWFPPYPLTLNGPGWSLSVEAFFYLTFPLVLFVIRGSQISEKTFAALAVLFYFFTQVFLSNLMSSSFYSGFPSPSHDLVFYFPLSHYCSFLLGVAAGYIFVKNKESFAKTGVVPLVIMLALFGMIFWFLQHPNLLQKAIGFRLVYGASFYSFLFVLLILGVAYSNSFITRALSFPLLVLLGESSYAVYILQSPVHAIYSKFVKSYLDLGESGHFYAFLLLLVVVSVVVFLYIEKPGKRMVWKIYSAIEERIPRMALRSVT